MNKPTAESHFKAYAEAGLHDLAHRFIGEVGSHWSEQQGPQNLQRTAHVCPTVRWLRHAFPREGWLPREGLPWAENLTVFQESFQTEHCAQETDSLGDKNDPPTHF